MPGQKSADKKRKVDSGKDKDAKKQKKHDGHKKSKKKKEKHVPFAERDLPPASDTESEHDKEPPTTEVVKEPPTRPNTITHDEMEQNNTVKDDEKLKKKYIKLILDWRPHFPPEKVNSMTLAEMIAEMEDQDSSAGEEIDSDEEREKYNYEGETYSGPSIMNKLLTAGGMLSTDMVWATAKRRLLRPSDNS